jgi:hypothetical protein
MEEETVEKSRLVLALKSSSDEERHQSLYCCNDHHEYFLFCRYIQLVQDIFSPYRTYLSPAPLSHQHNRQTIATEHSPLAGAMKPNTREEHDICASRGFV